MTKSRKPLLVGFVGSPRENGNTAHLIRYALDVASKENVKTREIELSKIKIVLCGTQCNYECLRRKNCPVNDDVYNAYDIIAQADTLIVGCPAYGRRLPALMYGFLQRAQGLPFQWPLTNKPTAIIFICDEKYDCQPGKSDLEGFFGWKSKLVASTVVGTPDIDPPPSEENYEDAKKTVLRLLENLRTRTTPKEKGK